MDYLPQVIQISFDPSGYASGDYCRLHSNGGSGDIDWESPHDRRSIPLADEQAENPLIVEAKCTDPGLWSFGFESYDSLGNEHYTGTPAEIDVYAEPKPKTPAKMTPVSYNTGTDILVFSL